jgi:hypothetical protein
VLQLLVVVYSLSGDRMPPAPPLYSADEARLKEALADAMVAAAAAANAGAAQQQWLVQLECLPAAQHILHQVRLCCAVGGGLCINHSMAYCLAAYIALAWQVHQQLSCKLFLCDMDQKQGLQHCSKIIVTTMHCCCCAAACRLRRLGSWQLTPLG